MDKLVIDQRGKLGLGIVRIENIPRWILRALEENQVVADAVDKPVAADQGVPVTSLAKPVTFPVASRSSPSNRAPYSPGILLLRENYPNTYHKGRRLRLPDSVPGQTGRHHWVDATYVRRDGGNHPTISRSMGNVRQFWL